MINYDQSPTLAGVYLEDSYVLAVVEAPARLTFELLAVLTPEHPAYHDPRPGEHYCYGKGNLVFADAVSIEWLKRTTSRYVDAAGEEDFGNIDVRTTDGRGFVIEGDWGEVRIQDGAVPHFELSTPPGQDGD